MRRPAVLALARRQLRAYAESPAAAAALFAYYLLLGYLFAAPLFAYGQASLRPLLEIAPLLQTFLIPALTMGLLAAELESGTFETLVSFPLGDEDVVAGKYLGFVAFHAAATAALLVFAVSARALAAPPAGLDWGEALGVLAALWAQGLALGAAGLFASTLSRSQLASFVVAFALGFALLLGGKLAQYAPQPLAGLVERLAFDARMSSLGRGVLDSRDLLYFASLSFVFLYLAVLRLEARRLRVGRSFAFSAAGGALTLGAVLALNAAAAFAWTRVDFSAGRAYSLSPGSRAALSRLEEPLVVQAYFTAGLPAPYSVNERYLRDLLAEYRSAGKGKVSVRWQDPSASAEVEKEARAAGIEPVQVNLVGRGQFSAREAFMGAALLYKGRKATLPVVASASDLEYELTRRLKTLVDPAKKVVGFTAGHGERDPGDRSVAPLFELLRQQMSLSAASLEKPWPGKLDALWIFAPTQRFTAKELDRLREWVRGGGALGILLSRRALDFERYTSEPRDTGLETLLAEWGVSVSQELVADAQSDRIETQRRVGPYLAASVSDYPLIPVATRFARGHAAMRGLEAVSFPFTHALTLGAAPAGVTATPLAESSPRSWLRSEAAIAPDQSLERPSGSKRGPFALAAALEGPFAPGAPPARVVVVAASSLLDPRFANRASGVDFLLNLLDWSYGEEELLALRAKGPSFRPLRPVPSARARALIRASLACALPLAVLAFALAAARGRRLRRARAAARFSRA